MDSTGNYPAQYESWLTLKNGQAVFIRPVKATDGPLIVDSFNRLSTDSLYMRFLRPLHDLPREMLYKFTHLNYSTDFALAALIDEAGGDVMGRAGGLIAIARYAYDPQDKMTELAIVVRDDWQHFGLGKPLLKKLVDIGKEQGIYRFSGMIDPRNRIIMQILKDLGYKVEYCLKEGIFQVDIQI